MAAYTRYDVETMAEALRSLPAATKYRLSKQGVIAHLAAEILGLQERGYTIEQIAPTARAMDDELERFKRDVNLTELAATYGYRVVVRERSSAGKWRGRTAAWIIMRNAATDDKIIIGRAPDGHWLYHSNRNDKDTGSIVDFLQERGVRSLGEVRKRLREWLHQDRPPVPVELYRREVPVQQRDEAAVAAAYARARPAASRYLAQRCISLDVERDPRFADSYRVDGRGNVLFPHVDPASGQVVGFEIKNRGFTGFATGGRKTFWSSANRPDDTRLVLVETAIDAFSYHQPFPHAGARYISTGGGVGTDALALIGRAISAMPAPADVVSATDADEGGEKLHRQLEAAGGRPLRRHASPLPKDWNDYLQKTLERSQPHRREHHLER